MSAHSSASVRPPAPAISIGATNSWLLKPVASTITSASRSRPPARTPRRRDRLDALGDELDVRPRERRVPVVGEHDPLAAGVVAGVTRSRSAGSLMPRRMLNRPARLGQLQQPQVAGHGVGEELVEVEDRRAVEALQRREALEQRLRARRVGVVELRERPAGRALVDGERRDLVRDRGHDLDGAAARPDHGHALARQRHVVAPLRGVERGPGERRQPRQRWDARLRELPAGGDQDVGRDASRRWSRAPSAPRPSAPSAPRSTAAPRRPSAARRPPRRPGSRPAARSGATTRVRRERELVQVRRDVARRARIRVVVPDAAEPLAALEQRRRPCGRRAAAARRRRRHRSRHRRSPPKACAGP